MCHVGGVLGYGAYAGKKDVSVKLGGMLNRGAALNFRELPAPPNSAAWAAAWRPYVEPCIELFGAERCNFESNFPVDKMGTGYATLWNTFKRITAGCSHTEKLALYSGTAVACGFTPRSVRGVAAGAEPEFRIHLPPAASQERTIARANARSGFTVTEATEVRLERA